ncbi:MAG TPA: hypothetical protein H9733_01795 [Candidatus Anaerotignum merdipullorum]|nr:hypothetical protein [Candidatus Anaerotignum merdipullorum]
MYCKREISAPFAEKITQSVPSVPAQQSSRQSVGGCSPAALFLLLWLLSD